MKSVALIKVHFFLVDRETEAMSTTKHVMRKGAVFWIKLFGLYNFSDLKITQEFTPIQN